MVNYIPDTNPFRLAGPPNWWLQKLWDFDSKLVVVPSRQMYVYRLAMRKRLNLPEAIVNEALFKQSDTRMLASYGLVPITTIIPTANWSNPYMFEEMRRRTPHMMGGAERYADMVEAQEAADAAKTQQLIDDRNEEVARDGWRLYLKKIGLRSQMYSPKTSRPTA